MGLSLPECSIARVCQSVHAVCARVWHTTQCACSVCWCVDRLQATGLRPTWHRPAARASEPPKKRLLRQQRVEESLHSRTRARQLLLSSEKSSSLPPAFPPPLHPTAVALRLLCDAARWVQHSAPASSNKQ